MRSGEQQTRNTTTPGGGALLERVGGLLRRYAVRNERMRVCETLHLGGRRSVALIECDGERFLVGMSATGVQTMVPVGSDVAKQDARGAMMSAQGKESA